jgi:hypothetical protein
VRALKTGLGGVHLVLRRRLFHQWASYSGQAATGNAYFLETVFETVAANLHDPFLAFLDDFVRTRETYRADSPTRGLPDDEIFSVMIALHVYLTLRALPDTDLMIATSDLHDAAYRAEVVRELHALTGLNIDLADAQERIDLPRAPIADLDQTRLNTEALCGRALREVGGGAAEAALCDRMLQEVWTDVRLWTLHTEAPRQQLEAARRKLAELGAGGGDAAALADAQARIAGLMDVLAATERAGKEEAARRRLADAARGAAEAAQAQAQDTLRARDETIRTLIAERDEAARLEEARREVVALTLRNQQLEERVQDLLFAVEHYKAGQGIFKRRGKRDESEPR